MKKLGISATAVVSLLLLIGFFFLGETVLISVLYGLIGGLSVYYIISWWQNDEKSETEQEPDLIPFSKDLNKMLVKTKIVKPENTKAERTNQPTSILEWLIKEDKSPPSR
ncbi:MAG: hypothetical protein WBA77_08650 [Microcoleaceae cyanobacterium]